MAAGVLYLDTSALVKLVSMEVESLALLSLVDDYSDRVSSALAATELRRAVRRQTDEKSVLERSEALLEGLTLLPLTAGLLKAAGEMGPPELRSLDAIHLATATLVGSELGAFVAYDRRLVDAAKAMELPVQAPGASFSTTN